MDCECNECELCELRGEVQFQEKMITEKDNEIAELEAELAAELEAELDHHIGAMVVLENDKTLLRQRNQALEAELATANKRWSDQKLANLKLEAELEESKKATQSMSKLREDDAVKYMQKLALKDKVVYILAERVNHQQWQIEMRNTTAEDKIEWATRLAKETNQ